MGGLYGFYETHGLPLDILLQCVVDQGYCPDLDDLMTKAIAAGMRPNSVGSC